MLLGEEEAGRRLLDPLVWDAPQVAAAYLSPKGSRGSSRPLDDKEVRGAEILAAGRIFRAPQETCSRLTRSRRAAATDHEPRARRHRPVVSRERLAHVSRVVGRSRPPCSTAVPLLAGHRACRRRSDPLANRLQHRRRQRGDRVGRLGDRSCRGHRRCAGVALSVGGHLAREACGR